MQFHPYIEQFLLALAYYAGLLIMMRLAGKRLAGQTTTFDLIILISLAVVLQTTTLKDGADRALIFVVTVFASHRYLAFACARWPRLRHFIRGAPRELVRDGRPLQAALDHEGISREELLAGLRKLGYQTEQDVAVAVLEETGHISAIARGDGKKA